MNTLTIRTLGLPWLSALVLTGLAIIALTCQFILPPGLFHGAAADGPVLSAPITNPAPISAKRDAAVGGSRSAPDLSPSDLFAALTAREHAGLREQLTAMRSLLDAPGGDPDTLAVSQVRARLSALIASQDQVTTDAPPALVLTTLIARIDNALGAIRQAGGQVLAGAATADDTLLKIAVALAFAGALMALLAGPLALAPAQMLSRSLSQAALGERRTIWGIDRQDEWGAIAREATYLREHSAVSTQIALPGPTDQLRETAEAMSRLLLDSGQELARMRGEAGDAVNNAVMLGARLADAVLDAETRLQSRGQQISIAHGPATGAGAAASGGFADPAALWSAASAHADRLEEAATRALAAATVLPAAAERIENAIAGLDRMAEAVAANSDGLADLAARAGAAAAMLPEAAERIEAAANGLSGVASRTSSAASVLPQAAQLIAQASSDLGRAAEAVAANAAGLNEAVGRHTEAASSLPAMAERIEIAVSGLDRSAASLDDATDHVRITSRAAAAAADNNETIQRGIADAAQRLTALGEQLPPLTTHIAETISGLSRTAGVVGQAADRVEGTTQVIAAMASSAEEAQVSLVGSTQTMAVMGEQLPGLARQIHQASTGLEQSVAMVAEISVRAEATSRNIAAVADAAVTAQSSLSGAVQRMASFGEELPGIAFQIADATTGLDQTADAVHKAADRAEQATLAVAALATNAEAAQAAMSATIPQLAAASSLLPALSDRLEAAIGGLDGSTEVLVAAQGALSGTLPHVAASIDRLPVLAERFEAMLGAMDGTASMVLDAATSALEAGRAAEASATESAAAQAAITQNLRQAVDEANHQLPELTHRLAESVTSLQQCTGGIIEVTAGALRAGEAMAASQSSLSGAVECIVTVGDGLAGKLPILSSGLADQVERLDTHVTNLERANLSATVRQIAGLASNMAETLPPLSTRISAAIKELEGSTASLSTIGASAGEALPAAASRIDEALAGLDATVQIIAGAAQTAAASMTESAGTQSALAQTVQCMASVGEALPSLAMRLEGTLGALDRSTDTIVAAANDVAEAGRLLGSHALTDGEEGRERRPGVSPVRPGLDAASMRRLQSVASALAMASNGSRG